MEETEMDSLFNAMGLGFPKDSNQLDSFNKIYKDFVFKASVNSINPQKILESVKKSNVVITQVDYHKRTVLAAEIVYRLQQEWSMGHLKLQKLIYLCQNALNMSVHANFLKQTMGPYDPILMRSLDKQFKQHKWFEFNKDIFPKYKALENAGGHHDWYQKYYQNHLSEIEFLIDTFKTVKTPQIELIATIYACWMETMENKEIFSNDLIIQKVYKWSKHKEKFSQNEILSSITWMLDKGIYPKTS